MKVLIYAADPEERRLGEIVRRALVNGAQSAFDIELLPFSSFAKSHKKKAIDALVYLDAAAEPDAARLIERGAKLGAVDGCAWAILDRSGAIADPAALFFAGAKDYIGPQLIKAGVDAARVRRALAFAGLAPRQDLEPESPASPFPGWNVIKAGQEIRVRFCYAAVGNQRELLERIGEKRLNQLKEDYASFLEHWAKECGGIVWIREKSGCLLLFPPRDEGMNPLLAAFRLLLDRALIGYEVFKLETPLTFRFAFHCGATMWKPPGATGTLVSDDVNFIFHLGTKAASDGVIVVSEDAERCVPTCIRDLFSPAGDFEGRMLSASKRFRD